ncbi:MAG TPA: GYF domain-containing protein [Geminicoccaceae bacterium]|nr:GYF domain-containing protein [Geminicoccaceae bacterium]
MSEIRGGERWRYRFGGEIHGPYGFDDLRVLAARGELPRHAQVAPEGSEDWRDASVMPALLDAFDDPALAARAPSAERPAAAGPHESAGESRPATVAGAVGPEPAAAPRPAAPRIPAVSAAPREDAPPAGRTPSELVLAHVVYGLYALNFFVGFTGLIGVVIAYVKRSSVAGQWLATHYNWQIRSFWYGLAIAIIALILARFLGWLVVLVGAIWLIYRIVVGWRALAARQPVGDVDPIDNFIRGQLRKVTGSASRS